MLAKVSSGIKSQVLLMLFFGLCMFCGFDGELFRHKGQSDLLREYLLKYETINEAGGWPSVGTGSMLQKGVRDERVILLRRYLGLTGDLASSTAFIADSFDTDIENAIISFQERHGLSATGIVDEQTRNAINVPIARRIQQLQTNVARWEMFQQTDSQYVFVNIPDFSLEVIKDDRAELNMKTIVGRSYRPSPSFKARIEYIEFNPSWYVPPGIKVRDVIPQVKKDVNYPSRMDMHVYKKSADGTSSEVDPATIDWDTISPNNVFFVQDPGPLNPMGVVKFLFPNRFNVYLHDTPSKELFEQNVRLFSSGCIRISKAKELANYLLSKDDPWWTSYRIDSVIATGRTKRITLQKAFPICIEYFTSWVDASGRLNLRQDIYNRDL